MGAVFMILKINRKIKCDRCKKKVDKVWVVNMDFFKCKHVDFNLCSLCATDLVRFIKGQE